MKNTLSTIGTAVVLTALVFGGIYFHWWRCGEMFPNAQLACFLSGK